MIVLKTYDNYISANVALGKLRGSGIRAVLQDEHTATVDPFLTNAINGIKLIVSDEEAGAALSILDGDAK